MPRKNRIHYRSAFHHVMLRGNNRKNIFHKKEDYQLFLDAIRSAADAYNFKIHLYCLMTNHIHLVVEVGDIQISRIMQSLSSRYAKLHNKKYNKIGHLFQGRFKSKLISDDYYLMELCYYIHMNPIKAKLCQSLDEYHWSSHYSYKSQENTIWLVTDYICKIILNHFDQAANYQEFIANYKKSHFKPIFCKFNENGDLDIPNDVGTRVQSRPSLALENMSLTIIEAIVCKQLRVSVDSIASSSLAKRVSLARSMIAYFAHYHAKYTFDDIAAVVCRQPNSISKTLRRHLKLVNTNSEVRHVLMSIEKELSISDVDRWVG